MESPPNDDGVLLLLNRHLIEQILVSAAGGDQGGWSTGTTELDSHANMVVFGNQGTTIQDTGKFSDVNVFAEDVGMMPRVPIVDSVIAYDCSYSGEVIFLVARNALFVVSMDHNLVPPFIMREEDYRWDEESKTRIPLQLYGTLSVFTTRKLTQEEVNNAGEYKVIFISPDYDCWNPKCEAWAVMEDDILDFEG